MTCRTGVVWTLLSMLTMGFGCSQDYEIYSDGPNVHPDEVTECDFNRVGDSPFWAYECNPVFSTTGEGWAQSIKSTAFLVTDVLGHPFYQLWYTGVPDDGALGDFGLGYAISQNGTDWEAHAGNPLLEEPESTAWDGSNMETIQGVWDRETEQYVMIYLGYNLTGWHTFGLGVATSPKGRDWVRLEQNPVVDFMEAETEEPHWCWPLGLTLDRDSGFIGYRAAKAPGSSKCEVFSIHAPDVTEWMPSSTVTYAVGAEGEFDDEGFVSVAIAELDGIRYMFYAGFSDWSTQTGVRYSDNHSLGWATSTDGLRHRH